MVRYCPNNSNNDKFEDNDDEDEHYKWKLQRNLRKRIIKEGVYCQNCFNEGHFTKEWKLLMKICRICKANDHNIN
jgi:hypothetical protein